MSECESLGTCPFFNDRMANMPAMKDLYKDRYCRGGLQQLRPLHGFQIQRQEPGSGRSFPQQPGSGRVIAGKSFSLKTVLN